MTSDPFDDFRDAWQSASDRPPALDPDRMAELQDEAAAFERTIYRRDRIEFAAVAIVVVGFAVQIPFLPPLAQLGCVLSIAGALYVGWRLRRAQRAVPPVSPDAPASEAIGRALQRAEVQIDLLRRVLEWYLLPLVPGGLLFVYGAYGLAFQELRAPVTPAEHAFVALVWAAPVLILGSVFGFVYWLNQRAVRKKLIPLRNRFASMLHELGLV